MLILLFICLCTSTLFVGAENPKIIDFFIMVDTQLVYDHYRTKTVSQDYEKPTSLEISNSTFIVAPKKYLISGQASTNLHIRAECEDILRWRGYTGSGADTLVYDIVGSNSMVSKPTFEIIERNSVQLVTFPTVKNSLTSFSYVQTKVLEKGSMNYKVRFGLYNRGEDSGEKRLFGYFEFDATLKVEDTAPISSGSLSSVFSMCKETHIYQLQIFLIVLYLFYVRFIF